MLETIRYHYLLKEMNRDVVVTNISTQSIFLTKHVCLTILSVYS